jgi:hypothetical protein
MRRLLLSLALAASLSALSASAALAAAPEGAQKAPIFGPFTSPSINCETGAEPTPETFGFAVLNTTGNETTVSGEAALKRAAPQTAYEVFTVQGSGPCEVVFHAGTLTTNKKGNGNLHFAVARFPFATKYFVELVAISRGESFISSAVELD